MNKTRFDLFVKNLNLSNHPKSYTGNKLLDKMAERKTEKILWLLHDNGINMDKFIEYNLMNIDCQWRYNVVMSAVQDGLIKTKDIKTMLDKLEVNTKALIVTCDKDEIVYKSGRNIEGVKVTFAGVLNVYDILSHDQLIIAKDAIAQCPTEAIVEVNE
jgi:hypothetical protein